LQAAEMEKLGCGNIYSKIDFVVVVCN